MPVKAEVSQANTKDQQQARLPSLHASTCIADAPLPSSPCMVTGCFCSKCLGIFFIEQLLDDLEPHKQHRESINIHHGSLVMVTMRTNVLDCCATYCLGLKRHHRLRCQNNPRHCLTRFPSLPFHSLPFHSLPGRKSSHPANQSSKKAMECSGDILIIQKIDESIISRLR